jgi:hypothetical protein
MQQLTFTPFENAAVNPFDYFLLHGKTVCCFALLYTSTEYKLTYIYDLWLTVTEYLCRRWPRVCSVCRNYNSASFPVSWLCILIFNQSNTMGTTRGAGTTNPFRTTWVNPEFVWGSSCSMISFLCSVFSVFHFRLFGHCIGCPSSI